ncbi:hypothetical protein F5B22DRAFT_646948 [Xylaria bambusicola]|uniref:uncharacterized protein n=1 Tax=Xylaria bambusicola TaxID=326684 RepID=UPI0020076779|nr:uncharacterized protein F5B22DRAFT_646948 [Xylaria bambusicola]KAI0515071.1 hypothetical protein F5B22DRAFT_646948 [Xylaria bambusicola]
MSGSRDVQSFQEIRDIISSTNPPRAPEARFLLTLIQTVALAFRTPDSPRLTELVEFFHHYENVAGNYPENETDMPIQLVNQWFSLIDKCFFFGVLTSTLDTQQGPRQVVELHVENNPSCFKRPNWHANGCYDTVNRRLWIWLKVVDPLDDNTAKIARLPILRPLYTVIHESIHAYLDLFADKNHPLYFEEVGKDRGHGPVFKEILHLVSEKVEVLTRSTMFAGERYMDPSGPPGSAAPRPPPANNSGTPHPANSDSPPSCNYDCIYHTHIV